MYVALARCSCKSCERLGRGLGSNPAHGGSHTDERSHLRRAPRVSDLPSGGRTQTHRLLLRFQTEFGCVENMPLCHGSIRSLEAIPNKLPKKWISQFAGN